MGRRVNARHCERTDWLLIFEYRVPSYPSNMAELAALSVRELKKIVEDHGLSHAGIVDKGELRKLAAQALAAEEAADGIEMVGQRTREERDAEGRRNAIELDPDEEDGAAGGKRQRVDGAGGASSSSIGNGKQPVAAPQASASSTQLDDDDDQIYCRG